MSARPLFCLRYCGWLEYALRVLAESAFLVGVIWLLAVTPWFGRLPSGPRILIIAAVALATALTIGTLRIRRVAR